MITTSHDYKLWVGHRNHNKGKLNARKRFFILLFENRPLCSGFARDPLICRNDQIMTLLRGIDWWQCKAWKPNVLRTPLLFWSFLTTACTLFCPCSPLLFWFPSLPTPCFLSLLYKKDLFVRSASKSFPFSGTSPKFQFWCYQNWKQGFQVVQWLHGF